MMQPDFFFQALQMARSGHNPMGMLQQMAGRNPGIAPPLQMIQGKNSGQLRQMAENMARERGVDLASFAQQLGLPLPK